MKIKGAIEDLKIKKKNKRNPIFCKVIVGYKSEN